jgi:hypothetical protein
MVREGMESRVMIRVFLIGFVAIGAFSLPSMNTAFAQSPSGAPSKTRKAAKNPKVETPVDWVARAEAELEAVRRNQIKKQKGAGASVETGSAEVLPTPATVRADVTALGSVVEPTAMKAALLIEPYQPKGTGYFGSGEVVDYQTLPSSVLVQGDLRWLPFDLATVAGRSFVLGGYAAFGYSRQKMPLVAPSGFRYDDVALNTMRVEGGLAAGIGLSHRFNFELRGGVGRQSHVQTSRYSDVVGTFARPFAVVALDLSYYFLPRFAFVVSAAHRAPIGGGDGSVSIDPMTVSGGLLVQVR